MKPYWAAPDDVDLSDPITRAYWGVPEATPERVTAWQEWKTSYVTHCVANYLEQGASREQAIEAGGVVWMDVSQIDDMPWLPLGVAKSVEIGAVLMPNEKVSEDDRVEFMLATRTSVTSTESERTQVMAYQLGLTIQQAAKYMDRAKQAEHYSSQAPHPGRTAVYRHFDADGVLLYIGIAKDPAQRSEQHGYHSRWWRFVADTTVTWFDTRDAALNEEREAIGRERPVFNGTHNTRNREAMAAYLFAALDRAAQR